MRVWNHEEEVNALFLMTLWGYLNFWSMQQWTLWVITPKVHEVHIAETRMRPLRLWTPSGQPVPFTATAGRPAQAYMFSKGLHPHHMRKAYSCCDAVGTWKKWVEMIHSVPLYCLNYEWTMWKIQVPWNKRTLRVQTSHSGLQASSSGGSIEDMVEYPNTKTNHFQLSSSIGNK